ncbi:MAG: hypothetical protein ACLP1X_23760 [Polyangiaceae bacterium]
MDEFRIAIAEQLARAVQRQPRERLHHARIEHRRDASEVLWPELLHDAADSG